MIESKYLLNLSIAAHARGSLMKYGFLMGMHALCMQLVISLIQLYQHKHGQTQHNCHISQYTPAILYPLRLALSTQMRAAA